LRYSCLNRDRLEKTKRDKRKRGKGARGLLGPAGHALGFDRRSGAERVGGRLGRAKPLGPVG
jgi:hypothetical protein